MQEEQIKQVRKKYKKELQDCIANGFNPLCHAANWDHLKSRIISDFGDDQNVGCEQLQSEIVRMLCDMKCIVEKWLEYYKQHNVDGCYDSWLERFWIEEKPDTETEEKYYMMRMYEKFVQEGIIEIYYYIDTPYSEIKQKFLNKWYQKYNRSYEKEEDEYLYIGRKGIPGDFYFGYGDFYEPIDSPRKSAWWKLVSHVLETEKLK